MKVAMILIFLMISGHVIHAQINPTDANFDFVISVDNDIPVGGIARPMLELKYDDNSQKKINVYYHPGDLKISESDYTDILSDKVKEIRFVFSYYKNGQTNSPRDYEIEIKKWWFKSLYNVIRIYNVDKGPYKGVYTPLGKDRPYTFELFSPNNTFTRVRNK